MFDDDASAIVFCVQLVSKRLSMSAIVDDDASDSFSSQDGEVDDVLLYPCIYQSLSMSVPSAYYINGRACLEDNVHDPELRRVCACWRNLVVVAIAERFAPLSLPLLPFRHPDFVKGGNDVQLSYFRLTHSWQGLRD